MLNCHYLSKRIRDDNNFVPSLLYALSLFQKDEVVRSEGEREGGRESAIRATCFPSEDVFYSSQRLSQISHILAGLEEEIVETREKKSPLPLPL